MDWISLSFWLVLDCCSGKIHILETGTFYCRHFWCSLDYYKRNEKSVSRCRWGVFEDRGWGRSGLVSGDEGRRGGGALPRQLRGGGGVALAWRLRMKGLVGSRASCHCGGGSRVKEQHWAAVSQRCGLWRQGGGEFSMSRFLKCNLLKDFDKYFNIYSVHTPLVLKPYDKQCFNVEKDKYAGVQRYFIYI